MPDHQSNSILNGPSCSIDQAAAALSMSRQGVRNAIKRGDILAAQIGKRFVIPTAQLRKILLLDETGTSQPTSSAP